MSPAVLAERTTDEPNDIDRLAERIRDDDGWDLALDDPCRWAPRPDS